MVTNFFVAVAVYSYENFFDCRNLKLIYLFLSGYLLHCGWNEAILCCFYNEYLNKNVEFLLWIFLCEFRTVWMRSKHNLKTFILFDFQYNTYSTLRLKMQNISKIIEVFKKSELPLDKLPRSSGKNSESTSQLPRLPSIPIISHKQSKIKNEFSIPW